MDSSTPDVSRKSRLTWRGKLCTLALAAAALLVLIAIAAQLLLAPIIHDKLEETVAAHLDAALAIGSISYWPPFTVHLHDVRFVAHPKDPGGGTELLAAQKIDLALAKLPLGQGPLVIERFGISGLTLHVIRGGDGKLVGLDLARPRASASSAAMKLSDVLRLRHFSLDHATLIYLNQAQAGPKPIRWQGISSEVALVPQSASLYGFQLGAADEPIARAKVDGTIDVDSFLLHVNELTASVQSSDAAEVPGGDPLPPELRDLLHRYSVRGSVTFTAAGSIPLKNPALATLDATIGIKGGGATVPGGGETLNDLALSIAIRRDAQKHDSSPLKLRLLRFRAVSAGAILAIDSATGLIDPAAGRWSINGLQGALDAPRQERGPWGLTGHADFHADIAHDSRSNQTPFVGGVNLIGINVEPPGAAAPVQALTGSLHLAGTTASTRQIDFQNISALYGGDQLRLDHAVVGLGQFPDRVLVSDIQSHLDLAENAPECPGDLGPILDVFRPSGPFNIVGTVAMQQVMRDDGPGYSPQWNLNVSTENGKLALFDGRLPVTGLTGQMVVTKHAISIPGLHGTLLGGSMELVATARVVEPIVYQGEFDVQHADVQRFAEVFDLKSPDGTEPSGVAGLRCTFFSRSPGSTTAATTGTTNIASGAATTDSAATQDTSEFAEWLGLLAGDGSLQIDDGNLWALPALQTLSRHTRIARQALTAGEAAAIFSVRNRTIYFKHAAVYSPALGLQGSGTEKFNGALNLDIIAAPLGDWKQKLAETNIPFFSRILSSAAGSIEKFVGNATSELLYHFRITGTRDNPIIQTIPAPFLTDSAANLFARMIHHDGSTKLVDSVAEK
jgi:hypothetical protein